MATKLTITFDYVVEMIDKVDTNGKKKTVNVYTKSWEIESFTIIKSTPSILQFKTVDGTIVGFNLNDGIRSYMIENV
jgi:hypothetical protein